MACIFSKWLRPWRSWCKLRRQEPTNRWPAMSDEPPQPGGKTLNIFSRELWAGRALVHLDLESDPSLNDEYIVGGDDERRALIGMEQLFKGHRSSLMGVRPWCGGMRLVVNDDGNCAGTAWMVCSIIWAAQDPSRLAYVLAKLEKEARRGALDGLTNGEQAYVSTLLDFMESLRDGWRGHSVTPGDGANRAVDVVKTLLGESEAVDRPPKSMGAAEPRWLKLHRGIVLVSRALDLWVAPPDTPPEDMVRMQTIGESVEYDLGDAIARKLSSGEQPSGEEGIMRPGLGLGLVMDLAVERVIAHGDRPSRRTVENYMEFFAQACNVGNTQPIVEGLTVLKGELPHYDVFVVGETPLGRALQASYGNALEADDARALVEMSQQRSSQEVTTNEMLAAIVGPEDMARQQEMMRVYETNKAHHVKEQRRRERRGVQRGSR